MKTYIVTIHNRSGEEVFWTIREDKTAMRAKIRTWRYFNKWYNCSQYSRCDVRITAVHPKSW